MSVPTTMRAARLHAPATADRPADLRIDDDVPVPTPGPDQVLVRIAACGVCASDLHVVDGITPHGPGLPLTLGHEPAGTIVATGDLVTDWRPGDRVAFAAGRPCRRCEYCLAGRDNICANLAVLGVDVDGAQAEYAVAPTDVLVPLPAEVAFEQAAIVVDAVATPYHALKRGGVGEGVTVAVVGLGGLGMHAVQLAKLAGCDVVGVDIDAVNLERALDWGADEVVDASDGQAARAVRRLTGGGVDRAFEFVGVADTVDQAVKSCKPGGRAVVVGLSPQTLSTVPIARFVSQETELVGSFGATTQDVGELYDLLAEGRLDLSRSVTHRTDLDGLPDALDQLRTREGHPIRTVVTYPTD
ncbi:alcohol dehydrogenase catalytic domain-containing protein [Nitriliruptoraceae bacterium ZYF776]|nr:alcohol dehydrogenase catalytic domain-containing protein [Profundirhabdus halotolerans]